MERILEYPFIFDVTPSDFLPLFLIIMLFSFIKEIGSEYFRRCYWVFFALALLPYCVWRASSTLTGDRMTPLDEFWATMVFVVETMGHLDALFLLFVMGWRRSNAYWADAFERAWHEGCLDVSSLPKVDVFIPTYNEPEEVLRRTIIGARSLLWPREKLRVVLLDDGRRDEIRSLCRRLGVEYMTRPDNRGAKAGNLNAALARTDGEFFVVFDADFVPLNNFLLRTMGVMLSDERIGIVQTPHDFFNADPMRFNLGLSRAVSDEQKFFFHAIQPCRDAWDSAMCCGSNSVTRRSALAMIGDRLPTDSITEDMLLTLVLLRHGYVTRYLDESLAYGLAPENPLAMFVQRERWMRGAMQIVRLSAGPLGPGLSLMKRAIFFPTYWITTPIVTMMTILAPILFLWANIKPIANVSASLILRRQFPVLACGIMAMRLASRGYFHPVVMAVYNLILVFRMVPAVFMALVFPRGSFRVTPKGSAARLSEGDRTTALFGLATTAGMVFGLLRNAIPRWRVVDLDGLVPVVIFWAIVVGTLMSLVVIASLQRPMLRQEERFVPVDPVTVSVTVPGDCSMTAFVRDLSLSGVGVLIDRPVNEGQRVILHFGTESVHGRVVRSTASVTGTVLGIRFEDNVEIVAQRVLPIVFNGRYRPMDDPGLSILGWRGLRDVIHSLLMTRDSRP